VIAFGDEINDLEMLKAAGHGIAMKNAIITLKTISNDITNQPNYKGGVGLHLKTLFRLKK